MKKSNFGKKCNKSFGSSAKVYCAYIHVNSECMVCVGKMNKSCYLRIKLTLYLENSAREPQITNTLHLYKWETRTFFLEHNLEHGILT